MKPRRRAATVVYYRWCMKWRSVGGLDGSYVRLYGATRQFKTRRECKDYIDQNYGYIRKRRDLRVFPHGWRLPTPVRVKVTVKEI